MEEYDLPKYMRRHAHYLIMFGYITALRKHLPSVSIDEGIKQFSRSFNMEDGGDITTYKRMYERMNGDLLDSLKSK